MGRIIDYISHSKVWSSSAIFIEEDDGQNGVDHVDGYRSPGYIVSPYAVQYGATDHTYYTQVNMTRTMEQILGLTPMNQFDLIALPMRTVFTNNRGRGLFIYTSSALSVYNSSPQRNSSSDSNPSLRFRMYWPILT
jgi:hypothetical protein